MPRHWHALVLLVVAAAWLAVPADEAVARKPPADGAATTQRAKPAYPPAPAHGYSPRLVRQRMNNCAFASAAMLIDKWTKGRVSAPQHALRRAIGIPTEDGGPTLRQLRLAVAKVAGIDLRWSPHGGDPLTWQELLERLGNGGGALVNVWPEKLPRHYVRWIPTLTAGHSVYVERYSAKKNRLWLIDPLGRGRGFQGEWIDADVLDKAIWRNGGYVWAAATPPPPPPPPRPASLDDFDLEEPEVDAIGFSDGALALAIRYVARHPEAALPPLRVAARWQRLSDEQSAASEDEVDNEALSPAPLKPRMPTGLTPLDEIAEVPLEAEESDDQEELLFEILSEPLAADGAALRTKLATPTVAGDYALFLELRDGDGRPLDGYAAELEPMDVRLRGPLAGMLASDFVPPASVRQGEMVSLAVDVANLGSANWGEGAEAVALAVRATDAEPVLVLPLDVTSTQIATVPLSLYVNWPLGSTTLRLDLVDGSGAALPEAVAIQFVLEIEPPRRDEIR